MSTDVTVPSGEFVTVQGYEVRQESGADRTVVVDDQGAVHLPATDDGWMVRDQYATAPMTKDPNPVEDPAGRFELVDDQWRLKA
jgi:hypothetical protein